MARRSVSEARSAQPQSRYVVPGLERGLAILELFGREHPSLALSDIARHLGLPRSTVFRLLYTLEGTGYLAKAQDTGEFTLTPKALSLGFSYLSQLPLSQIAQPVLKALAEEAKASSHLVVLDGHDAVHIARITPAALIVSNLQVGTRRPAHIVPSGRMLLAHMTEEELTRFHRDIKAQRPTTSPPALKTFLATADADRARGYAYSKTMREPDLMSCASAVLDHSGAAVAAVAVIGPRAHMESVLREPVVASLVTNAAKSLSAKLGYRNTKAGERPATASR